MDIRTYIPLAAKTAIYDFAPTRERLADDRGIALLHYVVGVTGEVLEWGLGPAHQHVEEIGDMWWYTAGIIRVRQTFPEGERILEHLEALRPDFNIRVSDVRIMLEKSACVLLDQVKAEVFYGKGIDLEVFDIALSNLYLALSHIDVSGKAREANIAKLKARYGEKFTEKMAINRDLGDEQKAMDGVFPV